MPIRINLLAEQQAEEEMRRRDPVKRAIFIAVLLVALLGLWAGWLVFNGSLAAQDLADTEAAIKRQEKDSKAALDDQKRIVEMKDRLGALDKLAASRVLWAPALDALQQALVDNIQLSQIKVEQSYLVKEGELSKDRKVPSKPASSTEKIVLKLVARDYGRDNDQTYIKFKTNLLAQPYFKQRLAGENSASFSGITAPAPDKDDPTKFYFSFTLECAFPEVKRP